jgi:hypothetical protein
MFMAPPRGYRLRTALTQEGEKQWDGWLNPMPQQVHSRNPMNQCETCGGRVSADSQ